MKAALPVEGELAQEKASALARTTERLEGALAELAALDEALAGAPEGEEREARLARRAEVRRRAAQQLWYVIIQREALGLRDHEVVYRTYRVPPEVRVYRGR